MEPAPSPRAPRCSARRRASAASNTAANASAVAPSPASCALRVHLSHSCTARSPRVEAAAAADSRPRARNPRRRAARPGAAAAQSLCVGAPDSSAAADGVRTELRERGDDALFDPRQCRVVSTGSGEGADSPTGRTRFPAPRPPLRPPPTRPSPRISDDVSRASFPRRPSRRFPFRHPRRSPFRFPPSLLRTRARTRRRARRRRHPTPRAATTERAR